MRVVIKDGLAYSVSPHIPGTYPVLPVETVDKMAWANGSRWAEGFCRDHNEQTLEIDAEYKIIATKLESSPLSKG